MKKWVVLAVCFLAFSIVAFAQEDFENTESLTVNVEIIGHADIIKENSRARVDSVTVNLSLFPQDGAHQSVEDIEIVPDAKIYGNVAVFRFLKPQDDIDYLVRARVRTEDSFVSVGQKIAFPISSLPEEVKPYTQSTLIIDSDDPAISKIASDLVAGEDDLYEAVYAMAKWTRENVNYNLSSVTADVSQKASWVLLERKGVCDEITSLFIALLRSVGIPAKFVTGYAYTNSPLFPDNWGAHGWAEVYFPGVGWVPFDITYGQFGWVDAAHIKLQESVDPDDASTRYEWVGRDAELKIGELDIGVDVLSTDGIPHPLVQITVKPSKQEIGEGSYNAVEAKVNNLEDSYVMTELMLNAPQEVMIMGAKARDVVLKPREERSVYWIVRLDSKLEENFLYTFPLSVKSSRGASGESSFKANVQSPSYSLQEIGGIIDQRVEEEEKVYSSNLALNCATSQHVLYSYEEGTIECMLQNTGNTPLTNLKVCLAKDCDTLDLGISKSAQVEFSIDTERIGKREERITAKNSKVSKGVDIPLEVLDEPLVEFSKIELPSSTAFEEETTLSFEVGKSSYSSPQNLTILVKLPTGEKGWTMDGLAANQDFSMKFLGRSLKKGENLIAIEAVYYDGNGREYSAKKDVRIALEGVTFLQGIQLWVRDAGMWVEGLFS